MEYDLQKETRVWERIQGTREKLQDTCRGEWKSLLQGELEDACTYRTLAACLPQKERRCLLSLAQDEERHAKTLAAMIFLQEGRRECPQGVKKPCVTCLCEELRKRYREELAGAEKYEALAKREEKFSPQFLCLADDERRHAQTILCLLQRLL